jgi:hypothetical protein
VQSDAIAEKEDFVGLHVAEACGCGSTGVAQHDRTRDDQHKRDTIRF